MCNKQLKISPLEGNPQSLTSLFLRVIDMFLFTFSLLLYRFLLLFINVMNSSVLLQEACEEKFLQSLEDTDLLCAMARLIPFLAQT